MSSEVTIVVWTDANISRSTAYDAAVAASKQVHSGTSLPSAPASFEVRSITQEEIVESAVLFEAAQKAFAASDVDVAAEALYTKSRERAEERAAAVEALRADPEVVKEMAESVLAVSDVPVEVSDVVVNVDAPEKDNADQPAENVSKDVYDVPADETPTPVDVVEAEAVEQVPEV